MKKNEIKNKIRENLLILAELEIEGIISYLEIPEEVKLKMEEKVSEYDQMNDFDKLLVQKRHQLALRAISKDESNEEYQIEKFEMKTRTERFCFKFNKKRGCKIDLTGLYEPKYNPTYVFGVNLARSYLPSSYWAKPDLDDVSLYKDLWHSNNKKDLRPHNEKDKDERRIDRCSFYGKYIVYKGYPLNPVARTGFKGRGVLSHWGPSKGVGAILYNEDSNKFEFLGVENGKYEKRSYICTPGGFVDPEEEFEYASKRELIEEALGIKSEKDKKEFEKMFEILGQGELVKFGNTEMSQLNTDNAWTESITYAFRIEDKVKEELKLKVGSDAKRVMWIEIEQIHKDINVKEKLEEWFDLDERIDYILENFQVPKTRALRDWEEGGGNIT
uniref:Nudix hydrolase domain-containing protein n=1 Tax=Meloidogyne hapla TaxID=6305 RepID=A0A1I8BT66_MELHA